MKGLLQTVCIERGDMAYPPALLRITGERAPERIFLLGDAKLLEVEALGLFCSVKCPGSVILKTLDLAVALRDAGVPVIGGFHSSMEKECLKILLRGTQPVIICPARGLERLQLPPDVAEGIKAGRVLLVSPFAPEHRRTTAQSAEQRNCIVAELAGKAFVPHAAQGGKTEALCREIIASGKRLFTVDTPENSDLLAIGAEPLNTDGIVGSL